MPTFWDLPKNVRDIIYRHHLVYDDPVTIEVHRQAIGCVSRYWDTKKYMPPIFHLSKKAEREAIPFYYEMNVFDVGNLGVVNFTLVTFPRHWNRVKRVVGEWDSDASGWGHYGETREAFISLGKMKKLEELNIRIDETKMLDRMPIKREVRQRPRSLLELTSQQNLTILRFPGVTGLLTLTNIKHVNFVKFVNSNGIETGGMIPGGALETHILPRLKPKLKLKAKRPKKGSSKSFRFLDLPAEIRNIVYGMLLRVDGPIHPSKEPPTSAPKDVKSPKINENENTESALAILAVCKQMNEEAVGIFYNCNSFLFHYPTQLSAFFMAIGQSRQKMIRDITLYYHNIKVGGVELIDLALPLLVRLPRLKRLHILMEAPFGETNLRRGWMQCPWRYWAPPPGPMSLYRTNPALIPGMKTLFQLRNLTDIRVRDLELEKKVEELKEYAAYPNFPNGGSNANVVKLSNAYEHFNAALADAQLGKINQKLFEIREWQALDVFPSMDDDEAVDGDEVEDDDAETM